MEQVEEKCRRIVHIAEHDFSLLCTTVGSYVYWRDRKNK